MKFIVDIAIEDASKEEKGFFKAKAETALNQKIVYSATGYGRGPERAMAYAMATLADTIIKAIPEYPESK